MTPAPITPAELRKAAARYGSAFTTEWTDYRDMLIRAADALDAAEADAAEGRRLLNAWMIAPNEDDEAWDRLMEWEDGL